MQNTKFFDQPSSTHSQVSPSEPKDILVQKINELNRLCDELNPYKPLSTAQRDTLARYQIYDCYDPFTITNKLLVILEDAIEELEKRKEAQDIAK